MGEILAAVAAIAIVVVTVYIVILIRTVLPEVRKLGRAAEDISSLSRTLDTELAPAVRDVRTTLGEIDELAGQIRRTVERVDKVAAGAEHLLDSSTISGAASKVVKSSTAGLLSVYEGVKQGIRTLRGS